MVSIYRYKNNKYLCSCIILKNDISSNKPSEYISENDNIEVCKRILVKRIFKINISIDELLDKEIKKGKENFEIDDRIKFSNKNKYIDESYNLFRLEISNYLRVNLSEREKIEKILENTKITNKREEGVIKKILFKISDKDLYNMVHKKEGSDKSNLLVVDEKDKNLNIRSK